MIETPEDLRDWFLGLKLPKDTTELALSYWEKALTNPSPAQIRTFCVLACVELWDKTEIHWQSVAYG